MAGGRRGGFVGWLQERLVEPEPDGPDAADEEAEVDPWDDAPLFEPPESPPETPAAAPRAAERLRPPGAMADFAQRCEACGRCAEACPVDAIHIDPADGRPYLLPARTPCQLCADVPCAAACPTGALRPIPVADFRIGVAVILERLCLNTLEAERCDYCLDQCPIPGAIEAGPGGIPRVLAERCTGCGLCARSCKAYPQAIAVRGPSRGAARGTDAPSTESPDP